MLEVQGSNVIVGIDRSGSMDTRDVEGQSRYNFLKEKLIAFVGEAVKSAANNQVTAIFFSSGIHDLVLRNSSDAEAAFNKYPVGGSTATDLAINEALRVYKANPSIPVLFFLVTDGHPDDQTLVDRAIINVTKQITQPEDFRIMILTVGQRDANLTAWLEHLDADLGPAGAKYDIVGVNNLQEVDFKEAAAELIASTTTNDEATAGATAGKTTHRID
jgi:uncharacterized protein YegL